MDANILKKYTQLKKHYPIKKIADYFNILQRTGITNMHGGAQFLYMGKKIIEHEYTYKHIPNEEAFEELLDHADEVRQSMIYGAYKQVYAQEDVLGDDRHVRSVERKIQKDAQELLVIWMHFKGNVINEEEEKPGLWDSIKRGANNNDIKNYLFRRVPLDVFKTIVNDNIKFAIREYDGYYTLYDFHNGFVNIILEDLINYDYLGEIVDDFDMPLKEKTYNDLHQFLYDMLFETGEKAYAEAVRQYEEEYGYLDDEN